MFRHPNLKGWWRYEGNANDDSGSGMNGTVNGAVLVTGSAGRGYQFDGVDDWINLGTALAALQNTAGFTLAAWIKVPDLTGASQIAIYFSKNASGARGWMSFNATEQISGRARAGDAEVVYTRVSSAGLAPDVFHHVAIVANIAADTIALYHDGVAVAATGAVTFTAAATSNTASAQGSLGCFEAGASDFFKGDEDEVSVWNKALGESDIRRLMLNLHPLH